MAPGNPEILIVRILEACNAHCFMCEFRGSKDQYRMSVDEAEVLANDAVKCGIRLVRLTGGEPLKHKNIDQIVQIFHKAGLLTSIITNGFYLSSSAFDLATAGLNQIIVSLDGTRNIHDKARGEPGLFDAAVNGLQRCQKFGKGLLTRVNTVVGPHNYMVLPELFDLLRDLEIDSWSIIPLKRPREAWSFPHQPGVVEQHRRFVERIGDAEVPRLLGDSIQWIGRDKEEQNNFLNGRRIITPRGRCNVPNIVRYYIPKHKRLYECNCVPHRIGDRELSRSWCSGSSGLSEIGTGGEWLRKNGPNHCMGCEPINAALGEGRIKLEEDIFGF